MTFLRKEIPMKLPSAGNLHEHWRKRHTRIKAQRFAVKLCLGKSNGRLNEAFAALVRGEVLAVTFTRVSPRKLDSDNLAFAFKGMRDEVAAQLGVDDGSDSLTWLYAQESGKPCVRIEIALAAQNSRGAAV